MKKLIIKLNLGLKETNKIKIFKNLTFNRLLEIKLMINKTFRIKSKIS